MRSTSICLVFAAALAACSTDDPAGDDTPPTTPTWYQDVAPVVAGHCQSCHVDSGIAPFELTTYDDAAPVAAMMAGMVETGKMPPFGAVPPAGGCTPRLGFQDDPSLTADQIAMFRAWADAGAPAGDPATAAPLPAPPDRHLAGVTHEIDPVGSWITSGSSDQFICLTYDPGLGQDMWLTGIEFRPTDPAVVHHAVAFVDPNRTSEQLAGPDGTYDCFGGVDVGGTILGGYTPGALPFELLPGSGTVLPAGAMIVVQIHYHPLGAGVPVTDATSLAMRLTATPPTRDAVWVGVGNEFDAPILQPDPDDRGGVEFRVPANVAGHTETMRIPLPVDDNGVAVPLWSVYPHMHYVGTRMQVEVEHDDGSTECLIDAGRYDFQWQRMYSYDGEITEMPAVRNGDTLVLTCHYDNTVNNPNVMRALAEQGLSAPIDVYSGEQTLDEMCIVLVGAATP